MTLDLVTHINVTKKGYCQCELKAFPFANFATYFYTGIDKGWPMTWDISGPKMVQVSPDVTCFWLAILVLVTRRKEHWTRRIGLHIHSIRASSAGILVNGLCMRYSVQPLKLKTAWMLCNILTHPNHPKSYFQTKGWRRRALASWDLMMVVQICLPLYATSLEMRRARARRDLHVCWGIWRNNFHSISQFTVPFSNQNIQACMLPHRTAQHVNSHSGVFPILILAANHCPPSHQVWYQLAR